MDVEIRLLGGFEVVVDGVPVSEEGWRRRHGAGLVKLLAINPRRTAHREQVMDALWPDLGPGEAAPRLHKAGHFARKALGRAEGIVVQGETISLFPGAGVVVDAHRFDAAAEEALAAGTPEAAEVALGEHRGDLLPDDPYEAWTEDLRERLQLRHLQLLRQARRFEDVVTLVPTDEDAHAALMR